MNFQGARANKIMRDSNSNSRRATGQGYVINTDLQQVDEASYCKEAGKTGTGRKQKLVNKTNTNTNVGVTLTNDGTSSKDDERTLTPNSQLFIFQGKFENKPTASKLQRDQGTPCTLPGDPCQTYYGTNNLLNNTQVKVTAIDVGGQTRRASRIETEMGTQRFPHSKESETFLNNISDHLNRKNNVSIHEN